MYYKNKYLALIFALLAPWLFSNLALSMEESDSEETASIEYHKKKNKKRKTKKSDKKKKKKIYNEDFDFEDSEYSEEDTPKSKNKMTPKRKNRKNNDSSDSDFESKKSKKIKRTKTTPRERSKSKPIDVDTRKIEPDSKEKKLNRRKSDTVLKKEEKKEKKSRDHSVEDSSTKATPKKTALIFDMDLLLKIVPQHLHDKFYQWLLAYMSIHPYAKDSEDKEIYLPKIYINEKKERFFSFDTRDKRDHMEQFQKLFEIYSTIPYLELLEAEKQMAKIQTSIKWLKGRGKHKNLDDKNKIIAELTTQIENKKKDINSHNRRFPDDFGLGHIPYVTLMENPKCNLTSDKWKKYMRELVEAVGIPEEFIKGQDDDKEKPPVLETPKTVSPITNQTTTQSMMVFVGSGSEGIPVPRVGQQQVYGQNSAYVIPQGIPTCDQQQQQHLQTGATPSNQKTIPIVLSPQTPYQPSYIIPQTNQTRSGGIPNGPQHSSQNMVATWPQQQPTIISNLPKEIPATSKTAQTPPPATQPPSIPPASQGSSKQQQPQAKTPPQPAPSQASMGVLEQLTKISQNMEAFAKELEISRRQQDAAQKQQMELMTKQQEAFLNILKNINHPSNL